MDITPITREEFVQAALAAGIRHPFNDTRCLGEYKSCAAGSPPYSDDAYYRAMIARGAALAAQGWTPSANGSSSPSRRRSTYAEREMTALTGLPSGGAAGDCHYCGLDPRACDCV